MKELLTRRRALLAGGAGLAAAMTTGGIWLATRDNGTPTQAAWRDPGAAPSATPAPSTSPASRSIPTQPGPPGIEHADLLESGSAAELVKVSTSAWYSWALMDRKTGTMVGSKNWNQTNMTASMIKAWLAADYLRRAADNGQTPSSARMNEIRTMIRDSANGPASTLWGELGKSATISRMISICKLTDSRAGDGWSTTRLSARDTCRIAHAIGTGAAAGPRWTDYLVGEMQAVRGTGDFGIRKAWPSNQQSSIAIKNGWVDRQATNEWNVNCMALGDTWTMAVLTRWKITSPSWSHGAEIAKSVATQLRSKTQLI